MAENCNKVQGALGVYCPILMFTEGVEPLCENDGHGKACAVWNLAQKMAGQKIALPAFDDEQVKASPLYCVDYMLAGKKVLLVEDNPVSMKILAKTLDALSPIMLKAIHGQEALDLLMPGTDIGLVLLDMDMPVMNGSQLMEALYGVYGRHLPFAVVLVSELRNWAEAKRLIEQGVLAYVKKPYKAEELLIVLKQALFAYREKLLIEGA